jgi:hypothetical protein
MFVWTGHGWLGLLFCGLACWAGHALFGKEGMWHPLPALAMIVASSLACYVAGRWLNRGLPHAFVDRNPDGSSKGHTLGFIRLEYAGLLTLLGLGLILLDRAGFFD